MKNILIILIAVVIIAIALALALPRGEGPVPAQQSDEPRPFDMATDTDGNGIPDDFENAYRELMASQSASGEFDFAAMERFANRVPVSEETRRLRSEIDAKTQELLSATSDSRRMELMMQIQDLADRMVENDPIHAASLEYLDRLEPQFAAPPITE